MTEEFPKRSRLRWVDVAVLVLVLGMLIGLLLPSISDRTPARRTVCNNNLRQLSMAATVFSAAKDRYPGYAETIFLSPADDSIARDCPWVVALAPYLDQKRLSDAWSKPEIKSPPIPYVALLWCPSKGSPDTSRPVLSYVANVGLLDSDVNRPANGTFLDRRVRRSKEEIVKLSHIKLEDIVDGASNTILFSENLDAGEWPDVDKTKIGFGWWKTTTPGPEMRINGKRSPVALARPSSRHPGGVMAAFCDGSTRFVSEDIEYRVYLQLLTPDDQQSDMPEEWKRIKLSASDLP